MADLHREMSGRWESDLESIFESGPDAGDWTAPRWMTEGDILFFYQTSFRPKWFIRRLRKQVDGWPDLKQSLIDLLNRNWLLADRYQGSVFACARVTGPSEYSLTDSRRHYRERHYVPTDSTHIFPNPLDGDSLKRCVAISRGGSITPLLGDAFERIRNELSRNNVLPDYLVSAVPGGLSFRNVNRTNWRRISCSPHQRFIDEAQVRSYFLDYFLGELKDPRTRLFEECDCFRGEERTGVADYFVRIGGRWVAVEAKLNLLCERDIFGQTIKYISIDSIIPRQGDTLGERIDIRSSDICIVVDQFGLYVVNHGCFVGSSLGLPVWTREELGQRTAEEIRAKLNRLMG